MNLGVTPLGNRVLLEQVMLKKETKVILPGDKQDESQFDVYFRIAKLGEGVPESSPIKVGDIPVLGKYVDLGTMKLIQKNDKGMYSLIVVHYDDIAATEDLDDKNQFPKDWKKKLGLDK